MRNFASLIASTALAALVLSGCATTEAQLHTRETARAAGDLASVAASPTAPANTASVQVSATNYVGASATRNLNGDPLPSKWQSQNVSFARGSATEFQEIAAMITQATGIPVGVDTAGLGDIAVTSGNASRAAAPGVADPALAAALGSISGTADATSSASSSVTASQSITPQTFEGSMRLNYTGTLKGFLDLVGANFNVHWEYRSGRLTFMRTLTRVYDIPALPILANLSFTMRSNAGGNASEGTSAGQVASTEGGFDLWSDLEKTLEGVVANQGEYRLSPQTGQIVVVASPSTMTRVTEYVKQLNAQLNKQVAIAVKVYSVTLRDDDDYSSDVSVLFGDAGRFGLNLVSGGPVQGTAGLGWAVLDPASNIEGSRGMVNALSTRGDVSTVTSASVTALNGVPVPVQVASTQAYAQSVSTQVSPVTGEVTGGTVTPGEITTGFNLHLVPKILGNGSLLMQYGMNISELTSLVNFAVPGGGNIQLPNVSQRNFIQQAQIPNGATLVLAGYEQVRSSTESSGPLHSGLWGLGGKRNGDMRREIIVIAITPTVLDITPAAQAAYSQ